MESSWPVRVSQVVLVVKNWLTNAGDVRDMDSILGWEDPLEEVITMHSSILVWRIPWTEEPGGLQSIGSQRVGHNWSDLSGMWPVKSRSHWKWVSQRNHHKDNSRNTTVVSLSARNRKYKVWWDFLATHLWTHRKTNLQKSQGKPSSTQSLPNVKWKHSGTSGRSLVTLLTISCLNWTSRKGLCKC